MLDGQSERRSQSKQQYFVKIPLVDPIRDMIAKDVGDKATTVIDILEGTIPGLLPDNMYNELVEALTPVIEQKAKVLVGKVLAYKKKLCRDGNECRAKSCIFLHDEERKGADGSSSGRMGLRGRDNGEDEGVSPIKRRRPNETNENNEVVFNKVNESRHNPEDLRAYASKFGKVLSFKKLNPEKYLVVFEVSEPAGELMRSSEPVLGDAGIKKFYNVMDSLAKAELKKLFDEQDSIIGRMSIGFSLTLLGQLRNVSLRIRNLVLKDRPREVGIIDHRRGFDQENSLYYNCF